MKSTVGMAVVIRPLQLYLIITEKQKQLESLPLQMIGYRKLD